MNVTSEMVGQDVGKLCDMDLGCSFHMFVTFFFYALCVLAVIFAIGISWDFVEKHIEKKVKEEVKKQQEECKNFKVK